MNRGFLLRVCLGILLFLNFGNAAAVYAVFIKGADFALGVVPLFGFDQEASLPTLFNGLLLGLASILAFWISMAEGRKRGGLGNAWRGVGIVLAFMFVDELAGIHEALDYLLMARVGTDGAISWPWVIPYGVLAVAVAGYFLRFYLRLDRVYQWMFGAAAALYVASAIGMEMAEAWYAGRHGVEGLGYGILYTIEENGEMLAVILANHGLLRYLAEKCGGFGAGVVVD